MTTNKSPAIPKPRKAVPCEYSSDLDEAGRNYARTITSPEVSAHRVIMACEAESLKSEVDVPGMLQMLRTQGEAFNRGDMAHAEKMLAAQATALQTLFARLTERAMVQSQT